MTEISYETLPIGQPGTFVLSERQRIEREMAQLQHDLSDALHHMTATQGLCDELRDENRHLKQMLVNNWRQVQSNGAHLIQWGQDMERTAAMFAAHLEELGVAVDVNVFEVT
jgi:monoamine oxidase